jgi:hypothetical protein
MDLKVLENEFKVIKLKADDVIPEVILQQEFYSVTKTDEELSIVVDSDVDVKSDIVECNWRAIKIVGVLDFSLIGILAKISTILAQAEISIFAISTYNTDYILLKDDVLEKAISKLKENGYNFV